MKINTEKINLDISSGGIQAEIFAKLGDTGTRAFTAELYERGKKYHMEDGMKAVLYADKPDGTTVFTNCAVSGGIIGCSIPSQLLSASGRAKCELAVFDRDGNTLTSPRFEIVIEDTVADENAIQSTNDYSALISALNRAERVTDGITPHFTLEADGDLYVDYETGSAGLMKQSVYDPNQTAQDIFAWAVPVTRRINGTALSDDVTLTAASIGAVPAARTVNGKALSSNISLKTSDIPNCGKVFTDLTQLGGTVGYSNTLAQVLSAMPDYSELVISRCGTSVRRDGGAAATVFDAAMPAGYGSLFVKKSSGNYPVLLSFAAFNGTNGYTATYKKVIDNIQSTLHESSWVMEVDAASDEASTGSLSGFAAGFADKNSELKKKGGIASLLLNVLVPGRSSSAYQEICRLPSGFRPAKKAVMAASFNIDGSFIRLEIGTDGSVKIPQTYSKTADPDLQINGNVSFFCE